MIEKPPQIKNTHLKKAFDILKNHEYLELIKDINNRYLYWDKVKYKNKSSKYSGEDLWAAVKLTRTFDFKKISFGNYNFSFSQTDYIQKILHEIDLNIGGTLGADKLLPKDGKEKYLISSIMEEAIASSQMEGAVTTRKKAKEMLRKNNKPRSKSDQMILNNYYTIKHIVENKSNKLSPDSLLYIHQLISRNTLDNKDDEGAFRKSNDIYVVNHIESEVVHTPPDFVEIPELINQICEFFNKDDDKFFIHPVIKGIILHFLIGFIHPFVDGNGRTARALFYWYLLSKGYWLTEYMSISRLIIKSKNQYEKAYQYTENDGNDLTYFLSYNLKTMSLAYDALRQYLQRKIEEKKYLTNFQRIPSITERQAEILQWYYDESNLVLTVKEVETRLYVSNQTARTDLFQLCELGFIEILKANKKKQIFVRSSNFDELIKKSTHNI
jgi:Fic family protein